MLGAKLRRKGKNGNGKTPAAKKRRTTGLELRSILLTNLTKGVNSRTINVGLTNLTKGASAQV